jgi:hypothetical protein
MFETKILKNVISRDEVSKMAKEQYGHMIKAVVDVGKGIMAIGGELHVDIEAILMDKEGSLRDYTWGINLHPEDHGEEFVEFDSMVNIKPSQGNRTRSVSDPAVREKIREVVSKFIK